MSPGEGGFGFGPQGNSIKQYCGSRLGAGWALGMIIAPGEPLDDLGFVPGFGLSYKQLCLRYPSSSIPSFRYSGGSKHNGCYGYRELWDWVDPSVSIGSHRSSERHSGMWRSRSARGPIKGKSLLNQSTGTEELLVFPGSPQVAFRSQGKRQALTITREARLDMLSQLEYGQSVVYFAQSTISGNQNVSRCTQCSKLLGN